MRYGKEKTYTIDELMTDLETGLFSELKTTNPVVDSYRRALQKDWIEHMTSVMRDAAESPKPGSTSPDLATTDIPAVLRAHMEKIMNQCKTASVSCTDPMTLAHLKYVQAKLKKILDIK